MQFNKDKNMRIGFIIFLSLWICLGCGGKKVKEENKVIDQCQLIDETLVGSFAASHMEGTMTFSGGLNGNIEIAGSDYNDISCTYTIADCYNEKMSMNCNGAPFESDLIVYNRDSMKIGLTVYKRVK